MATDRRASADLAPLTVRVPVAARMLGIGRTKLYELIAEHEIDVVKLGSATLVVVDSLQAFIERQLVSASSASPGKRRPGRPRTSLAKLAVARRT
jgi:excisionase family DNA binding protein